jgi:hypothetical protein
MVTESEMDDFFLIQDEEEEEEEEEGMDEDTLNKRIPMPQFW